LHALSRGQNAALNVLERFPFSSANLINTMMGDETTNATGTQANAVLLFNN
jgi:hypothetical protein